MGLDMYLQRKVYIGNYFDHVKTKVEVDGVEQKDVAYIVYQAGYWRKANHIHAWFVKNVQDGKDDCGTYYVSEENLKALLDACQEVLADPKKAQELLPTQGGFFFGSTEYDNGYIQDIEDTVKIVEKALKNGAGGDYEYHSSW